MSKYFGDLSILSDPLSTRPLGFSTNVMLFLPLSVKGNSHYTHSLVTGPCLVNINKISIGHLNKRQVLSVFLWLQSPSWLREQQWLLVEVSHVKVRLSTPNRPPQPPFFGWWHNNVAPSTFVANIVCAVATDSFICNFKVALIDIFIRTMYHMTMWKQCNNVRGVTCSYEPYRELQP